jgi:hypothetical protein
MHPASALSLEYGNYLIKLGIRVENGCTNKSIFKLKFSYLSTVEVLSLYFCPKVLSIDVDSFTVYAKHSPENARDLQEYLTIHPELLNENLTEEIPWVA